MARTHFRSVRKVSGKKYTNLRKKRLSDMAGNPTLTQMGVQKVKVKRGTGGNTKASLLRTELVLVNTKGKVEKIKIETVVANPANLNYQRRNIITKGAIVKTSKGNVRITSRPGQDGTIFGTFTEK